MYWYVNEFVKFVPFSLYVDKNSIVLAWIDDILAFFAFCYWSIHSHSIPINTLLMAAFKPTLMAAFKPFPPLLSVFIMPFVSGCYVAVSLFFNLFFLGDRKIWNHLRPFKKLFYKICGICSSFDLCHKSDLTTGQG